VCKRLCKVEHPCKSGEKDEPLSDITLYATTRYQIAIYRTILHLLALASTLSLTRSGLLCLYHRLHSPRHSSQSACGFSIRARALRRSVPAMGSANGDERTSARNDDFAPPRNACNDSADRIVAPVTSAFGLQNSQFHELLSRFIRMRDHLDRIYPFANFRQVRL